MLDTTSYLAWLWRQLTSIAESLLILAHLVHYTLGNTLVLLLRLVLVRAAFSSIGWRSGVLLLVLSFWGGSICVFNHSSSLLPTVNCYIDWRWHQNLQLVIWIGPLFNDGDLNRAIVAFVCNLTTATPTFFFLLTWLIYVDVLGVLVGVLLLLLGTTVIGLILCFAKRAFKTAAEVGIADRRTCNFYINIFNWFL